MTSGILKAIIYNAKESDYIKVILSIYEAFPLLLNNQEEAHTKVILH